MAGLTNRAVVERYLRAVPLDYETLADLRHPDFVEEWPQSGERIRGHDAHRRIHENYAGGAPRPNPIGVVGAQDRWVVTPSYTVLGIVGAGDEFTTVGLGSYPDGSTAYVVSVLRLRDGKVAKATTFFAAPFEAPAWRAGWIERMSDAERREVLK